MGHRGWGLQLEVHSSATLLPVSRNNACSSSAGLLRSRLLGLLQIPTMPVYGLVIARAILGVLKQDHRLVQLAAQLTGHSWGSGAAWEDCSTGQQGRVRGVLGGWLAKGRQGRREARGTDVTQERFRGGATAGISVPPRHCSRPMAPPAGHIRPMPHLSPWLPDRPAAI